MSSRIISSVLLLIVYSVNYLSTTGQLGSDLLILRELFPFSYMPAGRTFAVARSMIYLALGVWLVWSWTPEGKHDKGNKKITPWFHTSCLLNILRILFTAQQWYVISVITIVFLMLVLRKILDLLHKHHHTWYTSIPFGLYTGWITMAATIVGISQLIYTYNTTLPLTSARSRCVIVFGISIASRVFSRRHNKAQLFITFIALAGVASSMFG